MSKINKFQVGNKIETTLVLEMAEVRETNTKPPREYLNATFMAGNMTINAKMWNWPKNKTLPEIKKKYMVYGTVGEYLEKKQLTLTGYDLCADQDMTEFMPHVDADLDEMRAKIRDFISIIFDGKMQAVVKSIYNRYDKELFQATSARGIHHVGVGGNVQHTIEVATIALAICEACPQWKLDINLVIAGALLHDIGKAFVYDMSTPVMDHTDTGHLLEHISYGTLLLEQELFERGDSYKGVIRLLQHVLLSHHGKKEYGSPVTPVFMEAYVVNYADGISATLSAINDANITAEENKQSMTNKIWVGGNVQHYLQSDITALITGEKFIL